MQFSKTISEGFTPFTDHKEHTLSKCQICGATIKATQTNGPAAADSEGVIQGAYFLNLWLCRKCYQGLDVDAISPEEQAGK